MMTTLDREMVSYVADYVIMITVCTCAVGDAGNVVQTNLSKMKFHPDIYRANAYQGLIYDPMSTLIKITKISTIIIATINTGPVPAGLDFTVALSAERERDKSRQRKRRLSDSFVCIKTDCYNHE
jgi:hypothetical protein